MNESSPHIDAQLLSQYMSGLIVDDSTAREIEVHIESCVDCQNMASSLPSSLAESKIRELCQTDPDQLDSFTEEYQIVEELGRGGVGIVYRANQPRLKRSVALKMLASGATASAADIARFRREATALSHLKHRNIVTVHDSGEQNGIPYIAMELVDGQSLDRWLTQVLPTPQLAAEILLQLADGIDHAHRHGIIHRDLKPQNVLVEESPADSKPSITAKISDFGLSHFADENFRTQTGQTLGTPAYMAPEAALGNSHLVGATTDIYGLGAILYQCLTGRPPFSGTQHVNILKAVCEQDVVSISLLRPEAPLDLRTICERCLNKNPAKRFASALDLKDDLSRYLAGQPIQSRRVTSAERALKWARRNPWQLAVGATVAIATIGALMGAALYQNKLARERDLAFENYNQARTTIEQMLGAIDSKSVLEIEQLRELTWEQTSYAMQLYENLARVENTVKSKRDLAVIRMRAGTILVADGKYDQGRSLLDSSAQQLRELLADDPENDSIGQDLVGAQIKTAATLMGQNRHREAIEILEPLVAIAQQLDAGSQDLPPIIQMSWLYHNLGNALAGADNHEAAAENYASATDLLLKGIAVSPDIDALQQSLHDAQISHGLCMMMLQRPDKALESYLQAIEALKTIQQKHPNDTSVRNSIAVAFLNASIVYADRGELNSCLDACSQGIEQLTPIMERDPDHFGTKSNLTMLYGNRAMFGGENVETSLNDWKTAVKFSTDDETREYCRTMLFRQMINAGQLDELQELMGKVDLQKLSPVNQFRMAAIFAVLAATVHGESRTEEDPDIRKGSHVEDLLDETEKIMTRLSEADYFSQHPEADEHVKSNDDFKLYRKWKERGN